MNCIFYYNVYVKLKYFMLMQVVYQEFKIDSGSGKVSMSKKPF